MGKVTHTPGPWRISPACSTAIESAGGRNIASAGGYSDNRIADGGLSENEANARLIAAAPELLEMTKLLERSLVYEIKKSEREGDDEGANLKAFTLAQVRDTIARGEG